MSQYIYTMNGVSKTVPPKRQIIKDISLSFFPGAKIGLLGLNGAGKSTVLKIMAGVDTDFTGEARPQPGIKVGYLEQEPRLNPEQTVREAVEEGVGEVLQAQARLDEVYAAYAEDGADFDALAKEQERLEAILAAGDAHTLENQLEVAADALRLPPWDAIIGKLSGGEKRRVALCRLLLQKPDMLLLEGVGVARGQDRLQALLLLGQRVEVGAFLGVGGVDRLQRCLRLQHFAHAFLDGLADGVLRVQFRLLRQVTDLDAGLRAGLAFEVLVHAGHDLQHGGLAGTVQAQQADLRAREEGQRDVLDDLPLGRDHLADPVHGVDVLRGHAGSGTQAPAPGRFGGGRGGRREGGDYSRSGRADPRLNTFR